MSGRVIPFALAAAVLLGGAGCYQDDPLADVPPGTSVTKVLLTDAPFPFDTVQSVNIYIVSIAASIPADTSDPGFQWVTITEPRRRFDLLALQQGTTTLLGQGEIPAEQYRAVRVVIDADSSEIRFQDESTGVVDWGVGGQQAIHAFVEAALAVSGAEAEIVIDFDVGRSFVFDGAVFTFIPWIRAVNKAATGSIAGTIVGDSGAGPIEHAGVTAYGASQGNWQIRSTAPTDATGHYRLAFLVPGTYIVQVDPPRSGGWRTTLDSNVVVSQGAETDHSVTLVRFVGALFINGASSMLVNRTNQIEAVVVNAQNQRVTDPAIAWENLDTLVLSLAATTNDTASVTAVAVGTGRLVASSGGLSDTLAIAVYPDSTPAGAVRPRAARRAL